MLKPNQSPDAPGGRMNRSPLLQKMTMLMMLAVQTLNKTRKADFLAPLVFRLFLAPVFITVGLHKLHGFENTVGWFEHLGLPFPIVMASLAIGAEVIGGFCLLFGVAVRWMSVPLMVTMIVAAFTAHIDNGWNAIAPSSPDTNIAVVLEPIGFPGAQESLENSKEVGERLARARSILQEHGNYGYLTEKGSIVILNNGIEFSFIYFAMLLSLFFTGAGLLSFDALFVKKVLPLLFLRFR